jgi:hypothetical protein
MFVFAIILLDLGLQSIYFIKKGHLTFTSLKFSVRGFTYLVDDERGVTVKPNYVDLDDLDFQILTDSHGFRKGKNKISKDHNIVFIGDSVPFGWGVNVESSVPEILNGILVTNNIDIGIINASIPSYSLDQSVHRYIYEIKNKFPVDIVILQILDPASQFAGMGENWDTNINWTTRKKEQSIELLRYSSLYYLWYRFVLKHQQLQYDLTTDLTNKAISHYQQSIKRSLDLLINNTKEVKHVILLPVNIPKESFNKWNDKMITSITILNKSIKQFSKRNDGVSFIDITTIFNSDNDDHLFIDECCHLSDEGAELQSNIIFDFLVNNDLLNE